MTKRKPPAKMGRPRVVPGEESARIFATVSVDQKAKYQRLGDAAWLREKINKSKEPDSRDCAEQRSGK